MYEIRYHPMEFDVIEQLKEAALKDLEYEFLSQQDMQMQDSGKQLNTTLMTGNIEF